jgi:hypothetical protein
MTDDFRWCQRDYKLRIALDKAFGERKASWGMITVVRIRVAYRVWGYAIREGHGGDGIVVWQWSTTNELIECEL